MIHCGEDNECSFFFVFIMRSRFTALLLQKTPCKCKSLVLFTPFLSLYFSSKHFLLYLRVLSHLLRALDVSVCPLMHRSQILLHVCAFISLPIHPDI